jgi:hypothetical protein
MLSQFLALGFALSSLSLAQRPSNTSICDYYTTALIKDNSPTTQHAVVALLVNTVVIGNFTQPNVGVVVPGILAPAVYGGEEINLLPYFSGCLNSTNRNDMPVSRNFLDGGGAPPLIAGGAGADGSRQKYVLRNMG